MTNPKGSYFAFRMFISVDFIGPYFGAIIKINQ